MSNNEGISFFAGMLVGALAGAAMGMMLAPQSGEETRAQIKEQSIVLKEKANEAAVRGKIVIDERVAQLGDAVAEGKKAADQTRGELMSKLEKQRSGGNSGSALEPGEAEGA